MHENVAACSDDAPTTAAGPPGTAALPPPPLPPPLTSPLAAPAAMVRLTLIARVRDGLPLAEGLDADKEHEMYSYKSQAKVGRGLRTRGR